MAKPKQNGKPRRNHRRTRSSRIQGSAPKHQPSDPRRPTIAPRFHETYYYADVVKTVVSEPFEHLRLRDEFCCDGQLAGLVAPYRRESTFHAFIAFVVDHVLRDEMDSVDLEHHRALARLSRNIPAARDDLMPFTLPVEHAFAVHGLAFEPFTVWLDEQNKSAMEADRSDVDEYFTELCLSGPYEDLVTRSSREVFFILFGNRQLLLNFNAWMAREVQELEFDASVGEYGTRGFFDRPGVLKRARMPEWLRRAVFLRDRGRCVACRVDLSGLVSLWAEENYDHVVPLESGGLNDVTNVQLLCGRCNRKKASRSAVTSGVYEDWYSMTDPRGETDDS